MKWFKRLEVWGTILQGTSAILMLFPNVSTAYHIGAAIGIVVGTTTQIKGLLTGYQSDNLPSGITKVMDKIPDKITGIKGSAK